MELTDKSGIYVVDAEYLKKQLAANTASIARWACAVMRCPALHRAPRVAAAQQADNSYTSGFTGLPKGDIDVHVDRIAEVARG